jgi:hypothetical protein
MIEFSVLFSVPTRLCDESCVPSCAQVAHHERRGRPSPQFPVAAFGHAILSAIREQVSPAETLVIRAVPGKTDSG